MLRWPTWNHPRVRLRYWSSVQLSIPGGDWLQERQATDWHVATVKALRSAASRYYRNKLRPRNPTAHIYLPSRSPSAKLRRLPTPLRHRRRSAYSSSYESTWSRCCLCSSETASVGVAVIATLIAAIASISVWFEAFLMLCSLASHRALPESIKRWAKSPPRASASPEQSHRRRWRSSRRVPVWLGPCLKKSEMQIFDLEIITKWRFNLRIWVCIYSVK